MATGARHYGNIRATAQHWLEEVEIPASRIDDLPTTFSGGMQQRLQIARNLVTHRSWCLWMNPPAGWTCPCRRACSTCCAAWWWS
jgi:putative phosphonate transport system ATP-binding protein